MKHLLSLFVFSLALIGGQMTVYQVAVSASGKLDAANVRLDHDVLVENQPVLSIFLDVLRGTGVNGGFAEIAACSNLSQGDLKLKQGTTIREAMDALVSANPTYKWELQDGVVILMPQGGVPLLDTKIGKFHVDASDSETSAVIEEMLRSPEVRSRAVQLDLKLGLGQGGPGVYVEHPAPHPTVRFQYDWENFSLLEGLSRSVRTSPKAVWIYRETDCGKDKTYRVQVASDY